MDYKAILNLMKEMNHTDLTKVEIEEDGTRICLEKAVPTVTASQASTPNVTVTQSPKAIVAPQSQPVTSFGTALGAVEAFDKNAEDANMKKLVSPMVGTFYAAPSPDKSPYLKVGDKVKKGQTICIIEAMKLMNEIESEHDGEIVKILVNSEEMVEYGQPLFLVQ